MLWLLLLLFADQFDTAFRAGLIALNQNDLRTAESQLEEASKLQPRDPRVWLALAQTYWKLHKKEPAQAAASRAEEFTTDAAIFRGLAVYYTETTNYRKAAELLHSAIRRNPFNESYYFELAQLYLNQQNFPAALETLSAGRENFDKSAQLTLAAGVAYYGLRRFSEAIDAFLRTIELDPGVEQPYVFLGRMLDQAEERLPRIRAAFAAFSGTNTYLSNFLYGKCLRSAGERQQSETLLRRSIEQNEAFWESHFELGALLDELGMFADAAREIRRSIELNPTDPVPHYRLARLYDRLSKPAEARAERALHAKLSAAVK